MHPRALEAFSPDRSDRSMEHKHNEASRRFADGGPCDSHLEVGNHERPRGNC
jgi:hypothetical protein